MEQAPEPTITLTHREYGIISLFDGVSSVVPILKQKLGCAPTAIILAEKMLRSLVCAEFGIDLTNNGVILLMVLLACTFEMSIPSSTMIAISFDKPQ